MSAPTVCPIHHQPSSECPERFVDSRVRCGNGRWTEPTATRVVEVTQVSRHGDVDRTLILVCDDPRCEGLAVTWAEISSASYEVRPLSREDAEEATGMDLGVPA